ncbi:MAG: S-layer homology domain-containing protein, partial [Alkaliphilus sp.]|nr:S-layer homology domain-containing protein [Alkaliphilus sp.]
MKQKIVLIIIFTLLFSTISGINSDVIIISNAVNDKLIVESSNVENHDTDIPIDRIFILKFSNVIESVIKGDITLFEIDGSEINITISSQGNELSIKPVKDLKILTHYKLVLKKNSVTGTDGKPIDEISISFVTEKESGGKEQTFGQQFGQIAGQLRGYIDFLAKRRSDWAVSIPSNRKIISEYNLNKETEEYRDSFLIDFEVGFKKGYEDAYRNENFGTVLGSHADGAGHGRFFGSLLGDIHGKRDFYNNRTNDWTRWLPSDRSIINEYSLLKDDNNYSKSFVHAFKDAYKLSYINSFRVTNVEDNKIIKENGMKHGQTIGKLAGEVQGKLDYITGKDNDWRSNLPIDGILIKTYNLDREHIEYMEGFLAGYKEGYRDAYVSTFQGENLQVSAGNLNTEYISMHGGVVNSFDQEMKLEIEPGTIYVETALTISKLNATNLPVDTYIISATSGYNVKIQNISNFMDLRKPIVLEFKYHGPETAGIYELKGGKWLYLHSTVEDNKIFTVINTNKYAGGTYIVLIDETYKTMDDIGGHWAARSIETFLRRNHISGYPDRTFRPDQSITRAEFVKILDNV